MKRVLVTGATGFIGRESIPFLREKGYEVHAISSHHPPGGVGVHWHTLDLLDPGATSDLMGTIRPTHLLHFAWATTPGVYRRSVENLAWVGATLGLLRAFAAEGGERAVMAGTCFEYDLTDGFCSEKTTPCNPNTLYGTAKYATGCLLASASREMGISSAWGRIFFLYGPHEHPLRLVSSVILSLLRAEPASCTSGEQIRDFLHVRDVAGAFAALLDSRVEGAVNIGSGQAVAVREIVQRIGELTGRRELIRLGSLPLPPDEPPLVVADIQRLSSEVGWRPSLSLDQGLADTLAWWRAHRSEGKK
jgi:nucleoside-diphosphate-sugar epimerase